MEQGRHPGPASEPNVTPMIDVLLVVLIVFMVASIHVFKTMDVALSQPCTGVCETGDPIVLEVLPGPRYRVNQRDVASQDLLVNLRDVYWNRPDKVIQVVGNPAARYDDIFGAMDIAKSAGVRIIGVAPKELSGAR